MLFLSLFPSLPFGLLQNYIKMYSDFQSYSEEQARKMNRKHIYIVCKKIFKFLLANKCLSKSHFNFSDCQLRLVTTNNFQDATQIYRQNRQQNEKNENKKTNSIFLSIQFTKIFDHILCMQLDAYNHLLW